MSCLRLIFAYATDLLSKRLALQAVQQQAQGHEESWINNFYEAIPISICVAVTEDVPTNSGSQNCFAASADLEELFLGPTTTLRLAPCSQSFE